MTLAQLLSDQSGVVSRSQLFGQGLDEHDLARLARRRELTRVHTGVYVNHTGPLSWPQQAWAAVLFYAPAALFGESAPRHLGMRPGSDTSVIHVLVDHGRRVARIPGVEVHRSRSYAATVHHQRAPACQRLEHAVVHVASGSRTSASAVAVLADACQSRRTTAERLIGALDDHPRLPRRSFLKELLVDVAEGAYSVMEHRYLTRVERPHNLPTATPTTSPTGARPRLSGRRVPRRPTRR